MAKLWEEMPQEEKDKIVSQIGHQNWLQAVAEENYDAYVNNETAFDWRERQMRRFE